MTLSRQVELRKKTQTGELVTIDWISTDIAKAEYYNGWKIINRYDAKPEATVERRVHLASIEGRRK